MDKREFDIKIKAMLSFNKKIHTKGGATTENIKKLNYLIIEMMSKGCRPQDIYYSLCTGKHADGPKYDLLCRVTEQMKYPTLVFVPEVAYTDDLSVIKNCAMDEGRVRSSNWMKTIASVARVSEDELYRFTQCYMLLEQFGREEFVIDETVSLVNKLKRDYIPKELIGKNYHNRYIEINPKFAVISKLMCCKLEDYHRIEEIIANHGCRNIEEHQFMLNAYNSIDTFYSLATKFDACNIRGVQGDTSKYVFQRFQNGVPYSTNKYYDSYSMADAAKEVEARGSTTLARISSYVNLEYYESSAPSTPDDVM